MNNRVLVVGCGASGMFAAIQSASNGSKVTILEKNDVPGKKILVTGNGKCNLTNRNFRLDCYYTSYEDLNEYFGQFDNQDTIDSFSALGLLLKERDGYIYPVSEQASSVRDVLLNRLKNLDVEIVYNTVPESIIKTDESGFEVTYNDEIHLYDKVILACGSYAGLRKRDRIPSDIDGYSLAYRLGHHILPVKPALTQVVCKEDYFGMVAGVRVDALISLCLDGVCVGTEYGQVQITEYGLSGIPVFQLSRMISNTPDEEFEFLLDLMPGVSEDDFISLMQTRILNYQGATVSDFFVGILNDKLCRLMISLAGLSQDSIIDDDIMDDLISAITLIKCWKISVKGTKSFENAQCCSGGVSLDEVDSNCQSIYADGLYICGEMLDVDGKCGGYNLQWAWTTGYIAGSASSK